MINAQKLIELNSHEWEHHPNQGIAIQCQRRYGGGESEISMGTGCAGSTKDNFAVPALPLVNKLYVANWRRRPSICANARDYMYAILVVWYPM